MNELALFAGAGGGLLASGLLGWRTSCAVEINQYCRSVLISRQNDGSLVPFPIWDDVKTFNGKAWQGIIDVVSGGFPCQAYSTAPHGRNTAEDLWPWMYRIVADVAPRYVFAENVARKAIVKACIDLESLGYKTVSIQLSAKDLGADHIRQRYWLLAYADDKRKLLCNVNAETSIMQGIPGSIWESGPGESGVANGVAHRMDRIKATGNGQVPVVAATALKIMVEIPNRGG